MGVKKVLVRIVEVCSLGIVHQQMAHWGSFQVCPSPSLG